MFFIFWKLSCWKIIYDCYIDKFFCIVDNIDNGIYINGFFFGYNSGGEFYK